MTNELAPYCMTNDDAVMMIFVMNIIGIAYALLMNGSGIVERLKCMFYYESKSTPYNSRTHIARICNILMYVQTLYYSAIIASEYILKRSPQEMPLPHAGLSLLVPAPAAVQFSD